MILKTKEEITLIQEAGAILARCHQEIGRLIRPGITTMAINDFVVQYLHRNGANQVTKGYRGFPYEICASVNDVIAHGFPDHETLQEGDIVKIDIVCERQGWLADMTRTYPVGRISREAARLIQITEQCLDIGIREAQAGRTIGDVMHKVQQHAENAGYSIVRDLVGHGIGQSLHEGPFFPHVGEPGQGFTLEEGMVITIEPMINEGTEDMYIDSDGWTARTFDGKLSAQFEHTVAITSSGPVILTAL